jgi:hypothetical protein
MDYTAPAYAHIKKLLDDLKISFEAGELSEKTVRDFERRVYGSLSPNGKLLLGAIRRKN